MPKVAPAGGISRAVAVTIALPMAPRRVHRRFIAVPFVGTSCCSPAVRLATVVVTRHESPIRGGCGWPHGCVLLEYLARRFGSLAGSMQSCCSQCFTGRRGGCKQESKQDRRHRCERVTRIAYREADR